MQHRQIFWRRDYEHLAKTAEHQSRQRIANHRFVVDRQKLFADDFCQRIKTRSRATGEKNGFFVHLFSSPRITRIDANKSKGNIGKIGFGYDVLGLGNAFVFELRVVPEIHQEAEIETRGVQIV